MTEPYHYEQYQSRQANLPAPVVYAPAALTDQQPTNTAVLAVAWVVTVLTGLYMLPWAIAASRGKANQWAVFAVSLLLGWTVVGWIVALVMSCTAHRPLAAVPMLGYAPVAAIAQASPPAGWYPTPGGPGRQYWDGSQWTSYYS